jgi:hypothetical protein
VGAEKKQAVAKGKPEPTLGEILSGVDIVGTMLHLDLPRLEQHLQEIKALVAGSRAGAPAGRAGDPVSAAELAAVLEDLKEAVQLQNERLLSLERRLSHLTTVCEQWNSTKRDP